MTQEFADKIGEEISTSIEEIFKRYNFKLSVTAKSTKNGIRIVIIGRKEKWQGEGTRKHRWDWLTIRPMTREEKFDYLQRSKIEIENLKQKLADLEKAYSEIESNL